jgi:hypothetical protein
MSEFPRALTPHERAVLNLLLSELFPGRDELRQQAEDVKVRGRRACGCDTVDLWVEEKSTQPAPVLNRVPCEATSAAGPATDVLLHVVDGWLSELEVYRHDGEPATLPDSSNLKLR